MSRPPKRITWLEICVALLVVLVLLAFSLPTLGVGMKKTQVIQTLSGMKQLDAAMMETIIDTTRAGDTNFDWTCTNGVPMTLQQWRDRLVKNGYLTAKNYNRLMTWVEPSGTWFSKTNVTNSINVYAVTESAPPDTVLFSSGNWHGNTTTKLSYTMDGKRVFVVVQKGETHMCSMKAQPRIPPLPAPAESTITCR